MCCLSILVNVNCRWFFCDSVWIIFIFTFYCIFCRVTRSTVSVWSQFPSCKRKLSNVVDFDLYHAAVQHSSVNNKGKPCLSHRLACPAATLLFFLPTRAIIKVAEAESIRSSSSAVKPFIKTSNTSPRWIVCPVITFANQLSHQVIDWIRVHGSRILCFWSQWRSACLLPASL